MQKSTALKKLCIVYFFKSDLKIVSNEKSKKRPIERFSKPQYSTVQYCTELSFNAHVQTDIPRRTRICSGTKTFRLHNSGTKFLSKLLNLTNMYSVNMQET